jgi:hypothetical protein
MALMQNFKSLTSRKPSKEERMRASGMALGVDKTIPAQKIKGRQCNQW